MFDPNVAIAFALVALFVFELLRAGKRDRSEKQNAEFDRIGYCCNAFRLAISETDDRVGNCAIEYYAGDQSYDVPGCCGGGCNVLSDLKFCPWCGFKLRPQLHKEN